MNPNNSIPDVLLRIKGMRRRGELLPLQKTNFRPLQSSNAAITNRQNSFEPISSKPTCCPIRKLQTMRPENSSPLKSLLGYL
jgi:hypothetical protein